MATASNIKIRCFYFFNKRRGFIHWLNIALSRISNEIIIIWCIQPGANVVKRTDEANGVLGGADAIAEPEKRCQSR